MKKGVFQAKKKNGQIYYRAALTHGGKKISLGSFDSEEGASAAYEAARALYEDETITLLSLPIEGFPLSYDKTITILNHRDNGIYIKTPIYLRKGYFSYFLFGYGELKFDNDDLFYYSSHRILSHHGHLYVNDFGMQYGILARYGIKNYAVAGRDYRFANGDDLDFRYENIIVINRYHGVRALEKNGRRFFEARIHINGDYLIGRYESDSIAAIAYNKAADAANAAGVQKQFPKNYISECTGDAYRSIYRNTPISERLLEYLGRLVSTTVTNR